MDKTDRRVRRTREAIKEAFIEILSKKGFDAVTVQDITNAADINRSTFYAHYQDKFDLLDRTIRDVLERLIDDFQPEKIVHLQDKLLKEGAHPSYVVFFRHIREHHRLYGVMLGENGNPLFRQRITQAMREIFRERMPKVHPGIQSIDVSLDVFMSYVIGAELELAAWWVDTGMQLSEEEMALQLTRLNMLGPFRVGNLQIDPKYH